MRSSKVVFPVLLASLACSTPAASQALSVGGTAGLVAAGAWFEDDEANNWQVQPGLRVGAAAAYEVSRVLALHAQLAYVQKGWAESSTGGGGRRLTYLELPVLVALRAPWTTAPELLVGPALSLEIGCAVTGVPEAGSVGCDVPLVAWRRKKAQVGTWFGIGVGRGVRRGRLEIQLLGNVNFTNTNVEILPRGYTKLIAVSLSVTYTIPLGGS